MTITVRDEKGEPLPGTKIIMMALEPRGQKAMPQRQAITGDDGRVEVKLPLEFFYLRVVARCPTYVGMSATFDHETDGINKGDRNIADKVPPTFDFVLKPGIKLGGTIVNESGQPIPGVKVQVSSRSIGLREEKPLPTTNPKPIPDDYGEVVTNNDGRWVIDHLRERTPDIEYRVLLQHDDYVSDAGFGGLQSEQGVNTEMLAAGNSKIVMKAGPRIVGTVVDAAGQPVTKGIVLWHEGASLSSPICKASLNDQGEFRSKVLKAGNPFVTVVAPGFMPESRTVPIDSRPEKADFVLQPGRRIVIRIQDAEGNPLPKAVVGIDSWRGGHAISNNAPDLAIPSRANEDGVYIWDWAPTDSVTYRISFRKDPSYLLEIVSLSAQDADHVVTLRPPLTFSGSVTDAITGKPVDEFIAIAVRRTQPKWLWTSYQDSKTSRTGSYEINNLPETTGNRYHIRVEAKGYRTAISDNSYGRADGTVTLDFAMQPAAAALGRVINSAGEPVSGAFVIQATPTVMPNMPGGAIMESHSAGVLTTDRFGRFQLAASFEPARIRVIHAEGFAEVVRQVDERPGTLVLQPWSKVSGTLEQGGVPIPNQQISFYPIRYGLTEEIRFQEYYGTITDANGHFEFERLPPTQGFVHSSAGHSSALLSLKPGENRTVALGGGGVSVTGKVVPTGRFGVKSSRYSLACYLIPRGPGSAPPAELPMPEFDLTKLDQPTCAWSDSFEKWLAMKGAHISHSDDFHLSRVPDGEFDLLIEIFESPEGCVVETVGRRVVPIVVTDADVAVGRKDTGQIEVECRLGPRVGEKMRAYRFLDTDKHERSIHDLSGQYVLLHVWASSCSYCVNVMPEIQSTRQRSKDKSIQFIGWNIDENPDSAKSIVLKNKWDWPQTYLGANSDQVKQLALRHFPAYYLIDREGLLVASTLIWSEMVRKIDELK